MSYTRKGCDMEEKYVFKGNAGYEANLIPFNVTQEKV